MLPVALLAASLALTPTQTMKIDAVVAEVMRASHIPGLSLGVARKGHVVFLRGYGTRACTATTPADGYTVYRIGSITKQFTAALVMQEVDRGVFSLNAKVAGITIAQLLSQTSGLVSYTDQGQTLDSALNSPQQFTPGTQWQYSNSNYYVLGTTLQSATESSFANLLTNRITRPLGLTSTLFAPPLAQNVAQGCAWDGSSWQAAPQVPNDTPELAFSASAMSSNVPDLLAWLWNLYDGNVVSPHSFQQMTTSWTLADGTPTHYGFGFFTDTWYGLRMAHHPGYLDGFSADDGLVLDDGTAFAILTNADRIDLEPLAKSIIEIIEPLKNPGLVADFSHPGEFEDPAITALVKEIIAQLSDGRIDRGLLTPSFDATLTDSDIRAYAEALRPLGTLEQTLFNESATTGGLTSEVYTLAFERGKVTLTFELRGGKIDALVLEPVR